MSKQQDGSYVGSATQDQHEPVAKERKMVLSVTRYVNKLSLGETWDISFLVGAQDLAKARLRAGGSAENLREL